MHYGARMKEWITDHDIKQKALAKEFHVTEAMMSHYMTGRNEITVDVLVKFARKYALSMDYLVGLTENREPPLDLTEDERRLVLGYRASSRDQKEMLLRVCREITPEDRRQYQENLQLYQFYDQSLLPDREERMLEVDNNFHRLAFQIEGKELHFNRMLSSMHHVERFRILSLLALTDDRVYQDHLRILQAVSGQDPAELSRQVEIHLNRWQENSAAVRAAFPQYF